MEFEDTANVKTMLSNRLRPLVLGVALLASAVQAQVQPLDKIAAIVDNDVIMQSQFDQRLKEVQRTITSRGLELPPETTLRQQVMDRLIIDNLQMQMGERAGIHINDEELNDAVLMVAERNGLTLEQFKKALAADGLSYDDAREQIRSEIVISRVRQYAVSERIQVSDQEVQNFLKSDLGKMQLSDEYRVANILIPLSDAPSPAELQQADKNARLVYDQLKKGAKFEQLAVAYSASENALEGGDMGWRKAMQLPPPFDRLVGDLQIGQVSEPIRISGGIVFLKLNDKRSLAEAKRDETHARHILLKPSAIRSPEDTKRLAERIYERLQNGEQFDALAKNFSEDPGSALNGGDLNWVDPETLVPQFRETMARTKIGEISKPFQSQFGWHVLQVLDRRTTDSSTEVREQQALNILRNRKFEDETQAWLRQIRDEAYIEVKQQ